MCNVFKFKEFLTNILEGFGTKRLLYASIFCNCLFIPGYELFCDWKVLSKYTNGVGKRVLLLGNNLWQ
jgi:hypothetical protein